jgi:hypothetical protein
MHLSSVKISTVSNRTKTSFHLSLVIYEYHRVHPKWFSILWFVWRKLCTYLTPALTPYLDGSKQDSTWPTSPRSFIGRVQNDCRAYSRWKQCTNLASRLALSPNGQKRASIWASSPHSTIRCIQNDYYAYDILDSNRAPISHSHKHWLQMNQNEIWHDPHLVEVPLGAFKAISMPTVRSAQTVHLSCIKISTMSKRTKTWFHLSLVTLEYHRVRPKGFQNLWYVWRKLCTHLALTLAPSLNGPKRDSTQATSPRSTISLVPNDFQAYVMLGVNHAPILREV